MGTLEKQLFIGLKSEDDVGLVIRGHLHLENRLMEYVAKHLPFPDKCDWEKIGYSGKVELALACGLPNNIRPILEKLGELRNDFTSNLEATIEPNWVLDTYSSLSKQLKSELEESYKTLGLSKGNKTSKLDTKELLVLIFISVCQAINSTNKTTGKSRIAKTKKSHQSILRKKS